ncbi:MAG: low molecular weight protein-tyrosine-phosphatase [Chloroflexota bacterium]
MSEPIKVLFVCLGNICRSPMAENVMRQLVVDAGLMDKIEVDSAGTAGYHAGDSPHRGTQRVLAEHHIPCTGYSRQLTKADMRQDRTWIIGMDDSNMQNMQRLGVSHSKFFKLLGFADSNIAPADLNVPDPYYTGNFEYVYQLVLSGCEGLLENIKQEGPL